MIKILLKNLFRPLIKNSEKAFSLIELMVVMVIITILFTVGIPNYKKYQAKARESSHKATMQSLYNAVLILDSTDDLGKTSDVATVPDKITDKVKGYNGKKPIFQYKGADTNYWCIQLDAMDVAINLKACIDEEGEIKWGRDQDAKGKCTNGECKGNEKPCPLDKACPS